MLIIAAAAILYAPKLNDKPWRIKRGLDLAGGVSATLQAETDKLPQGRKWSQQDLNSVIRIVRNRVDSSGVSEPLIQPKGEDQVIVELPDLKNQDEFLATLQSTARLEFRHLKDVKNDRHPMAKYRMEMSRADDGSENYEFFDAQGNKVDQKKVLDESPLVLTGDDLEPKAAAGKDSQNFQTTVNLTFTATGKKKFADFTRRNVNEYLAAVMENKILSAPTIRVPILDGRAVIEGGFKSVDEAQRLAEFLNAGALPVPLKVIQIQKVEATLGQSSVDASVKAGVIGLGLVVIFMLGYYLLPGLIADIALAIYTLLTLAAFKLIGVTLTLPGIAAFILSIGMAVDANILIFERLKEELRSGKTLRAAIDAGFSRAFTSIFDSNMCTVITCAILAWLGTGPIRGFAYVLALGVAISMFTAITATRTILYLLVNTGVASNPILFGVRRQWVTGKTGAGSVNIVGKMWLWFGLSALVLIPGMFYWGTAGLNKGVDFTGGSLMQVKFQQAVEPTAIEDVLNKHGLTNSMVQKSTDDPTIAFIRTKQASSETFAEVKNDLKTQLSGDVQQESQVGATISKELTANAVKAVLLAALAIVLYLSVRFAIGGLAQGFRFGVCAILATLHDVGVIIGIFAILGHFLHWEIDSLFVTALLTVIGFSTHDTIVIFDRIRENMKHRARGENFDGLVNRSILQSFARSINTSFTVVLTLVALRLFGSHSINMQQFVVALLVGVISGTYSSIFNASQLLVLWQRLAGGREMAGIPIAKSAEPSRARAAKELKPVTAGAADSGDIGGAEIDVEQTEIKSGSSKPKSAAKKRKRRY